MKKKIWVIDDDEGILEGFKAILESEGYAVTTSIDADQLKTTPKKDLPDLIILDVLLSGQDGRDICVDLKKMKDTREIPIIMSSAQPGIEKTLKKIGAQDFLSKPFDMEDLLSKIKALINKR